MKALGSLFLVLASACSWTAFDELEGDTWVTATEKPANDSSNWGVAIQRGQATGTGGRLVVLGANQSLYSELVVTSNGDVNVPPTTLELNSQFGIGNLDPQPLLLADPTSNDVALVTSSGSASIAVLKGTSGTLVVHQVFGPATPDAATYMVPSLPAEQIPQVLVAQGDTVYGAHFVNPPNPQPSCKLVDDANAPLEVRALGATPNVTGDGTTNPLVWGANGKLVRFAPAIFSGSAAGCATGHAPSAMAVGTTSFMPGKGSQILTFEEGTARYAVLQGHTDSSGFLGLVNVDTMTLVGTPRTENGITTAALLVLGTKRYVIAGYPDAIIDGNAGAGKVEVFEIDLASGIGSSVMTLHDAQPEGGQSFGRAVTAMPFDGEPLIVVGADNEVFTYFRTLLYDETRQGR